MSHINKDGQFQSDKYPWCKPDFVPLKLSDPMAYDLLIEYALRRKEIDHEFSRDLIERVTRLRLGLKE